MTACGMSLWRAGMIAVALLSAAPGLAGEPAALAQCGGRGVVVQVLGSGGPELADLRASSSYLVWHNGKSRVLIDAGGGSALRFGQAGARVEDLDAVLFTHLHVDHSADFPALIKSSYFEQRQRALAVYGPIGSALFPATSAFIDALFDGERGAYRYLGDHLSGAPESYQIETVDVNTAAMSTAIQLQADLVIRAAGAPHGPVPALSWRIEIADRSIVFSGDTSADAAALAQLARRADVFVAHNAIPENAGGIARRLHMPPSVIGSIAASAEVGQLVLSHRMLRTLGREAETLSLIAASYTGKTVFADDLSCFALP